MLCLDLEGVLVPEVWQAVAKVTGVEALNKTTRDIPVYEELMDYRLSILDTNDIRLSTIQNVIATLEPLAGAVGFLDWARSHYQVAIVSDTFYPFAGTLMAQLKHPLILCHELDVVDDRIVSYKIRQPDPKRASVRAFRSLNYTVLAAGDSFNDVSMLEEADFGAFFCAPDNVTAQFPQYPRNETYNDLKECLAGFRPG